MQVRALAIGAGKHALLLLVVTLLPVFIYEKIWSSPFNRFAFLGGVTYPLYFAYVASAIRSQRIREFLHLLTIVLCALILAAAIPTRSNEWLVAATIAVGLSPFMLGAYARIKGDTARFRTCLFVGLLSLPLSLATAFLLLLGAGLSSMPRNMGDIQHLSPGLTPPSSGRHKGCFAPFMPPLMSNVSSHWVSTACLQSSR